MKLIFCGLRLRKEGWMDPAPFGTFRAKYLMYGNLPACKSYFYDGKSIRSSQRGLKVAVQKLSMQQSAASDLCERSLEAGDDSSTTKPNTTLFNFLVEIFVGEVWSKQTKTSKRDISSGLTNKQVSYRMRLDLVIRYSTVLRKDCMATKRAS